MKFNYAKCFKSYALFLPFYFYLLTLMGCATSPYVVSPKPPGIPGIYHRVESGQTLWGISRVYNVDLDELARTNRIKDATNIEVGQLIFIPHRQRPESLHYKPSGEDFIWPSKGRIIATFGQTFNNMINKGINIQTGSQTDVVASRSGKVVFFNPNFGRYGKTIIIDHKDGFTTVYAGNSQVFVRVGDDVGRGTLIAKAGSGDARDINTYLHFEIRKGYVAQNPYFYLPR